MGLEGYIRSLQGTSAWLEMESRRWHSYKSSTFKVRPLANLYGSMVSDLIDLVTKSWKVDLISVGFNQDDVAPILSIPLSRTGCRDILMWHYIVNGDYSVRSSMGWL